MFNATNAPKAKVFDVDTLEELRHVLEVNLTEGTIKVFEGITFNSELVATTLKYRSIYPIYGELAFPQLFHCYGRIYED